MTNVDQASVDRAGLDLLGFELGAALVIAVLLLCSGCAFFVDPPPAAPSDAVDAASDAASDAVVLPGDATTSDNGR